LIVDGIGVVGGLGVVALLDREITAILSRRRRMVLGLISIVALVAVASPTLWYSYAMVEQSRAAPKLVSFEHLWESAISGQAFRRRPQRRPRPPGWPGSGDNIAFAKEAGRWGILLRLHPYPDWRDYSTLSFVAASGSDTSHSIVLSIRDIRPDRKSDSNRYTERFVIGPDPIRYEISLQKVSRAGRERPFDIGHIESVILSAPEPGGQVAILMDDFQLE